MAAREVPSLQLFLQDVARRVDEERFDEALPLVPGLLREYDVAGLEGVDIRPERLRPLVAAVPLGLEREVLVLLEALRERDVPEGVGKSLTHAGTGVSVRIPATQTTSPYFWLIAGYALTVTSREIRSLTTLSQASARPLVNAVDQPDDGDAVCRPEPLACGNRQGLEPAPFDRATRATPLAIQRQSSRR